MAPGLRNKGYLNPKECWKDWNVNLGSLGEVQKDHLSKRKTHPVTDQAPSKSGIEKAAFGWALYHQDEARKDLEYAWQRQGVILTDEDWYRWLINAASLFFYRRPIPFNKFVAQFGLQRYVRD